MTHKICCKVSSWPETELVVSWLFAIQNKQTEQTRCNSKLDILERFFVSNILIISVTDSILQQNLKQFRVLIFLNMIILDSFYQNKTFQI